MNYSDRMVAWAQNEEMVDQGYTQHGKDCMTAAQLVAALRKSQQHLEARQTDTGLDIIRQENAALLRSIGEAE